MRGENPMDIRPPPCKCGEAAAARQDVKDNPENPRCHLCRIIAVEHPEWSPKQVARAGAARWREITPKQASAA
jgi:hypothetical protein